MTKLPVVVDETPQDCSGCGVCCFHMGYPAFNLPVKPLSNEEIESDEHLRRIAQDARTRKQLLAGSPGEKYWQTLPDDLRNELESFVQTYEPPPDGELDPPCYWLDRETRLCKHHEHRPRVCRNFEIGGPGCLDWRTFYVDEFRTM